MTVKLNCGEFATTAPHAIGRVGGRIRCLGREVKAKTRLSVS
jgi:hypothetical protein